MTFERPLHFVHDYARRVTFTTKNLVSELNSLHLHLLCVGIVRNSTALEIHLCKTPLIFCFQNEAWW